MLFRSEAARQGYDFILAHGRRPQGGFARTLGREGGVLDPALDLYDQAFVLFALAWMHRVTGNAEPLELAREVSDAVERELRRPDGEGYRSASDASDEYLQNPHMHLLEARLALAEVSSLPAAMTRTRSRRPDSMRASTTRGSASAIGRLDRGCPGYRLSQ